MALSQDYPGEPVPEETFTPSHLFWSSIIFYHLPPSTTIYSILPAQIKWLTVFLHNFSPSPLWFTSWSGTLHFILHTFLHPIAVFFCSTCPYQHNLFRCSTEIMSSNPSLSLNPLLGTVCCCFMPHIQLKYMVRFKYNITCDSKQ